MHRTVLRSKYAVLFAQVIEAVILLTNLKLKIIFVSLLYEYVNG